MVAYRRRGGPSRTPRAPTPSVRCMAADAHAAPPSAAAASRCPRAAGHPARPPASCRCGAIAPAAAPAGNPLGHPACACDFHPLASASAWLLPLQTPTLHPGLQLLPSPRLNRRPHLSAKRRTCQRLPMRRPVWLRRGSRLGRRLWVKRMSSPWRVRCRSWQGVGGKSGASSGCRCRAWGSWRLRRGGFQGGWCRG